MSRRGAAEDIKPGGPGTEAPQLRRELRPGLGGPEVAMLECLASWGDLLGDLNPAMPKFVETIGARVPTESASQARQRSTGCDPICLYPQRLD